MERALEAVKEIAVVFDFQITVSIFIPWGVQIRLSWKECRKSLLEFLNLQPCGPLDLSDSARATGLQHAFCLLHQCSIQLEVFIEIIQLNWLYVCIILKASLAFGFRTPSVRHSLFAENEKDARPNAYCLWRKWNFNISAWQNASFSPRLKNQCKRADILSRQHSILLQFSTKPLSYIHAFVVSVYNQNLLPSYFILHMYVFQSLFTQERKRK